MQRLLVDAEKISGIHYDISSLSDVYNAIHVVQQEMGVTGTTAQEAAKTIFGSANATKSAWQNALTAIGTGANNSIVSVINDVPTTGTSFGGEPVDIYDNESSSLSANVSSIKSYNYFYVNISGGNITDFYLFFSLNKKGEEEFKITNSGNITSQPVMEIFGIGNITINLNSERMFSINLGLERYITIDAQELEARKGKALKNRLVTGDYDNFKLKPGVNVINYTGMVDYIDFKNYSRWL